MEPHELVLNLTFVLARDDLKSGDQEKVFLNVSEEIEKPFGLLGVHLMELVIESIQALANLFAFLCDEIHIKVHT